MKTASNIRTKRAEHRKHSKQRYYIRQMDTEANKRTLKDDEQ